jgi:hypothetical protein
MQTKMTEAIKASIPEKDGDGNDYSAGEYLAIVDVQHSHHTKTYASTTIGNLVSMKYTGGGVRDHILKMSNMNGKLAETGMVLPAEFFVHLVFKSLPQEFSAFEVNYNTILDKWDIHKLIAMCVQEEDRLKDQNGGSVNYVNHSKKQVQKKNFPNRTIHLRTNGKVDLLMHQTSLMVKVQLRMISLTSLQCSKRLHQTSVCGARRRGTGRRNVLNG